MKKAITTCGIFLFDTEGRLLIVHPTNQPNTAWSIPKGIPDKNEKSLMAAFREFEEETGVNLLQQNWISRVENLGEFLYPNQKKQLIAYKIVLKHNINIGDFHCSSMVPPEVYGREVPEVDKYMWATKEEAMGLIHPSQKEALNTIS